MMMLTVDTFRHRAQAALNVFYRLGLAYPVYWALARFPWYAVIRHMWVYGYEHYEIQWGKLSRHLQNRGISLTGRRIVEVGAGNSLGIGYFLLDKCRSYAALDLVRNPTMSRRAFRNEVALIERVRSEHAPNLGQYCRANARDRRIEYASGTGFWNIDITDTEVVQSAAEELRCDLVFSLAVLEHVRRDGIAAAVENMVTLLDKGGYMFHVIDMRDHFNFDHPFHFYRYTDAQWDRLTGKSVFYTNRMTVQEYLMFFKEKGLTAVDVKMERLSLDLDAQELAPQFRNKTDLDVGGVSVLLKKE